MHTSLLDHSHSVMQKIAVPREKEEAVVLETVTKCQEVRNLWQFSFPLILFTLFPCLFAIRHIELRFIRNSNTRSTVDLTQEGTFIENLEYPFKIRYCGKQKKEKKRKEKREKNIVNDFAIFLQSSVPLSFKYSHFYNDSQIRHMHKSKARVYKNFIEIWFFSFFDTWLGFVCTL